MFFGVSEYNKNKKIITNLFYGLTLCEETDRKDPIRLVDDNSILTTYKKNDVVKMIIDCRSKYNKYLKFWVNDNPVTIPRIRKQLAHWAIKLPNGEGLWQPFIHIENGSVTIVKENILNNKL